MLFVNFGNINSNYVIWFSKCYCDILVWGKKKYDKVIVCINILYNNELKFELIFNKKLGKYLFFKLYVCIVKYFFFNL